MADKLYSRIKSCNSRYLKYLKVIEAINKDISFYINEGLHYNLIKSKLKSLPENKAIIIYDRQGILFNYILKYINEHYVLNNYKIRVVSDYLYPEYVSSSLNKRNTAFSDFVLIDASLFVNKKIIKNNRNKLRFLLNLRDEFTKEIIRAFSEIKYCENLLHIFKTYSM